MADTFTQGASALTEVTFTQKPALVDILFVVDNSPSMCEKQQKLSQKFQSFIAAIQQQNLDFHVGVTTTDFSNSIFQGKLVAKAGNPLVLTSQTPVTAPRTLATIFAENVVAVNSAAGSARSQGLLGGLAAVTAPLASGANTGFLRPDASLAVIIVSDEDDYSLADQPTNPADDYFVRFFTRSFEQLKGPGNDNLISISTIVGANPQGAPADCTGGGLPTATCSFHDENGHAGTRYAAVAKATGGLLQSICANDFGPLLSTLASHIGGLTRQYDLSNLPVDQTLNPTTVQVIVTKIDGTQMPVPQDAANGWVYSDATHSLVFNGTGIPPPKSKVTIKYGTLTRAFKLTHVPQVDTIQVTVSLGTGTATVTQTTTDPNKGWVFDPQSNSIVFGLGEIPPDKSVIDVDYRY